MQRLWSCALLLTFRFIPAITDPIIDRRCDAAWKYYGCFCYRFFNAELSWAQAKRECREYSAELVSIHSQEENDFVNDLMPSQAECWIGLHDTVDEETWDWIDQSETDFIHWAKKQPNSKDRDQDCVEFWSIESTWNDESCVVKNPFICKKVAEAEAAVDDIEVIPGATDASMILNTGGECLSYLHATDQETNKTWTKQRTKGGSTHAFTISPLQPCTNYTLSVVAEYKVDPSKTTPPFNVTFNTNIDNFPPAPIFNITTTKADSASITWKNADQRCISSYILKYLRVQPLPVSCKAQEACTSLVQQASSIPGSDKALISVPLERCSIYTLNLGYKTRFNDVIFSGNSTLLKTSCDETISEMNLLKSGEGVQIKWSAMNDPTINGYILSYRQYFTQSYGPKTTIRIQKSITEYTVEKLQSCAKYSFNIKYITKSGADVYSQDSTYDTECSEPVPALQSGTVSGDHSNQWLLLVTTILLILNSRLFPS